MKKIVILLITLTLALALVACGNDTAQENTSAAASDDTAASSDTLTPDQMRHDPMSFTGEISVEGIVGAHDRFSFSLSSDADDFALPIDYRGDQALPQAGSVIVVTGEMGLNCCGLHLRSTRFEVLE